MSLFHHVQRHFHEHYVQPHGRHAHLVLLIDLTLAGIILVLLGTGAYFAFIFNPLRDDFRFTVTSAAPLIAGRPAIVHLTVSNVGKRRLHDVKVEAHLPESFLVTSWPPGYDAATKTTSVGNVAPKGTVNLNITGTVFGPPQTVPVFVRMTASDDHGQPDERVFEVKIGWTDSLIQGTLAFPAKIVPNQDVIARYTLKNGSKFDLETVRVTPNWPDNFHLTASTPPVYKDAVSVGPIKAGESVTIEFVGRYVGQAESFIAGAESWWSVDGTDILLDRTTISRSSIDVNFQFQAKFDDAQATYRPGDLVPISLSYNNQSAYTLHDVSFELPLDPGIFDEQTPKYNFKSLDTIEAGATGTLQTKLQLKSNPSRYSVNPTLALKPTATFSIAEPDVTSVIVSGTGDVAKVSDAAALTLVGRYYTLEGEQVGRGPLPPKVGYETKYWAFASLRNGTSDLAGARLVIPLAPGVRWTGKSSVSAGDALTYDSTQNALVWDLGTVTAHVGTTDESPVASFELGLTPTTAQVGQSPLLIKAAKFGATDTWTGDNLNISTVTLTTKIPGDQYAQGKGLVRP